MLKRLALTLAVMIPAAGPAFAETITADDVTIEFYGLVQLDGIYDFQRVDPDWVGAFRPSKIATTDGAFGDDGEANFSVRQTLFGMSGKAPLAGKTVEGKFEFDLFGSGDDAGNTTFHLQRATVEWGPLMFGYTKTLLMDSDVFPNIIDYWGPNGMIFVKNPGVRFTPFQSGDSFFALALELPGNDVDPGHIRRIDPSLGDSLDSTQKLPDLIGAAQYGGDWGHIRLAGVARSLGFETVGSPGGEPDGNEFGWGVNLSGILKFGPTTIRASGVYGEGIASYFNDGGTDLAPELHRSDRAGLPTVTPHAAGFRVEAKPVEMYGLVFFVDHDWNDKFSSSIGVSRAKVTNTNFQTGDAYGTGDYALVNLLYKPIDHLLVGGELMYGRRKDNYGATGEDTRFQFSIRYTYGAKVMGRR